MLRGLFLASLVFLASSGAHGQALSVLRIKVAVLDAEKKAMPVARHVLLVSDNPPSAPPRAIVTAADGTATVRLRPGNYTVESERPVAFEGRVYEWAQRVDVAAGQDAVLELTADNATAETTPSATASPLPTDPSFLLPQWQGSVVGIWSPTTRASGFIVDVQGLVATNQRVIGTASTVEVQLTPEVKVAARVLAADPERDVAILWIDPGIAASMRPVPPRCSPEARPAVVKGQQLFTIGTPRRGQKNITSGPVGRVDSQSIVADFRLVPGTAGGPVFAADGGLVGISSLSDDDMESRRSISRVIRIDAACEVMASAKSRMRDERPPNPMRLPLEPVRPFPIDALKEAATRRAGSLSPPQLSSADFEIAFITPVLIYGAQEQERGRERGGGRSTLGAPSDALRSLREFSNWSEYVAEFPPVLLVRVTPKLVEGFWTTVARGAARTQGVALPSIKRFKAGFARMRAFCGEGEVVPIHPFKLEQRTAESEAIYEGLYVFDPDALGPHCGTVKLVLYSEKEPEKGDTRVVDPRVLQRIAQDFAPYRG
jgi:S1-C subfamily serine protease